MRAPFGAATVWLPSWAQTTGRCGLESGADAVSMACVTTWPPTIRTSSRRLLTSSASTCARRLTRFSAGMRRQPAKPSTARPCAAALAWGGRSPWFRPLPPWHPFTFAPLDTRSGEIIGSTERRHSCNDFVYFLEQVLVSRSKGREIHVAADDLTAHKTKFEEAFLAGHPNVRLQLTLVYSSWLNLVETGSPKSSATSLPRHLHFHCRPALKTPALHPPLQ